MFKFAKYKGVDGGIGRLNPHGRWESGRVCKGQDSVPRTFLQGHQLLQLLRWPVASSRAHSPQPWLLISCEPGILGCWQKCQAWVGGGCACGGPPPAPRGSAGQRLECELGFLHQRLAASFGYWSCFFYKLLNSDTSGHQMLSLKQL